MIISITKKSELLIISLLIIRYTVLKTNKLCPIPPKREEDKSYRKISQKRWGKTRLKQPQSIFIQQGQRPPGQAVT